MHRCLLSWTKAERARARSCLELWRASLTPHTHLTEGDASSCAPQREDLLFHASFWQDHCPGRHPAPSLLPPPGARPPHQLGQSTQKALEKLSHYLEFQLIRPFWMVPDFPGIISSNIQTVWMGKFSLQSFAVAL